MSSQDPRQAVLAKAVKDPAFRAELMKDPKAAIAKATGVKVPADVTVKVVEDSASVVHLVLPPEAAVLSDKALEKVAGGYGAYTKPDCCADDSTSPPLMCKFGGR